MDFTSGFLRAVVDTLLPGLPAGTEAPALPAASQVGVDRRLANRLHTHDERALLLHAMQAIADQAGGVATFGALDEAGATAVLRAVERADGEAFRALLFLVSADYYESKEVLHAFGWRAGPPQPLGYPLPPFAEDLLKQVKGKGQLWRSDATEER